MRYIDKKSIEQDLEIIKNERNYDTMAISANITKTSDSIINEIAETLKIKYEEALDLLICLGDQELSK